MFLYHTSHTFNASKKLTTMSTKILTNIFSEKVKPSICFRENKRRTHTLVYSLIHRQMIDKVNANVKSTAFIL
jgi:hypothetical protein